MVFPAFRGESHINEIFDRENLSDCVTDDCDIIHIEALVLGGDKKPRFWELTQLIKYCLDQKTTQKPWIHPRDHIDWAQ